MQRENEKMEITCKHLADNEMGPPFSWHIICSFQMCSELSCIVVYNNNMITIQLTAAEDMRRSTDNFPLADLPKNDIVKSHWQRTQLNYNAWMKFWFLHSY